MKILGKHLIVELSDCDRVILDDISAMEQHLNEAARISGATIVQSVFHRYNPQGVSGVVVIAESHVSLHTWPEYGYAAVDFFTCGDRVDPYKAHDYLREKLRAQSTQVRELKRGIPSPTDETLNHKPAGISQAATAG
ncbi:MAG: adenosylmethionine decarboxylase [candidate division Zixibacteria bacterium]|nr:adenosylmethionine decarboxylase [candidate division Zixibacteria bacterium]MDH3936999.1 adenosylmethionine decarboxylase [candidate division Zixibacteria bacterium]MDH4034582.1 adenosylmethionine decarboxylase [candidate division Zixibacteria bacterium]